MRKTHSIRCFSDREIGLTFHAQLKCSGGKQHLRGAGLSTWLSVPCVQFRGVTHEYDDVLASTHERELRDKEKDQKGK